MKNAQAIIEIMGGMVRLPDHYIRLENPGYMRLVIEAIGPGPRGLPAVSVAHYYEQNGDAMRDPEMTFEVAADGRWLPVHFENSGVGVYQEAVFTDGGKVMCRPRLIKELAAFAKMWDRNLKDQGWLDVAKAAAAELPPAG